MLYNIIGDTHGRTYWKDLVMDNAINIFVGDYFSPYGYISFNDCKTNFLEILEYKKQHPETILLIGNHDAEYWKFKEYHEAYSRHDHVNEKEIYDLFEENKEYFQAAYSIENKVLVTHAGVSYVWYDRYKNNNYLAYSAIYLNTDYPKQTISPLSGELSNVYPIPPTYSKAKSPEEAYKMYIDTYHSAFVDNNKKPHAYTFIEWQDKLWKYNNEKEKFEIFSATPDKIAEFVNKLWEERPSTFTFKANANFNDYCGTSDKQGPMWIRPETLKSVNVFLYTDYWQIFGHTQTLHQYDELNLTKSKIENIIIDRKNKLVCADIQSNGARSIIYNSENEDIYLNDREENK
jgi:hypothetical protein